MDKFFLHRKGTVFAIIDIQEKLAAVMKARDEVIMNCLYLIELAKMFTIPIEVTEQYPKGLGQTVEEIRNALPVYQPIEKIAFNCCEVSNFMERIKSLNRTTIILTGMEAHICVLQTCLGLLKEGFDVHVVKDAVCSRRNENWKMGLEFMRDAGAVITSTEIVLFQLLGYAGTEEFKVISKRIK